jgi:hypothetical protein
MNFFIIASDGQKYGPADIATLNHWIQEGRVLSTSMLEDASSGAQVPATSVHGLIFPTQGFQQPGYQYAPNGSMMDNGEADLKNAWICAIIGLVSSFGLGFCCSILSLANVFSIIGIVLSVSAKKKGNLNTSNALICSIAGLVIGPVIGIIMIVASQAMRMK